MKLKSTYSIMSEILKLFSVLVLFNFVSAVAQISLTTWFVKQSSQTYFCPTNEVVFLENGYFSGLQCASSCSRSPTCIMYVYRPETHICIGCASEFEIGAGNLVSSQYFRQFRVVKELKTWADAKTGSEELGGHLAVIKSETEQKSMNEILAAVVYSRIWIGGNDIDEEGTFVWLDGTFVSDAFENWRALDEFSSDQDCMVLHFDKDDNSNKNKWNDPFCVLKLWSLCEFN